MTAIPEIVMRWSLALLLPTLALAAPVPKAKEVELFYPTTVGTKRVLEMKRGDTTTETTETVDKVEEKDGVHTVAVNLNGGTTTFLASAKGLSRRAPQGNDPTPILRLDVKEGETWEYELKGPGNNTRKMTYTLGKREEVEVKAGKFQAVRVESETATNKTAQKATTWFAPGVGIVKMEYDAGGQKVSQELKEFTPGK